MRPGMTVQLRYVLSEPIYLVNGTIITEHGPMCTELCRFHVSRFHFYPHVCGACLRSTRSVPMSMHAPLDPLKRFISSAAFVRVPDDPTQRLRNFICIRMFGGMHAERAEHACEHASRPLPSKKIYLVNGFRMGGRRHWHRGPRPTFSFWVCLHDEVSFRLRGPAANDALNMLLDVGITGSH
jgi:hypothetical protein